LIRCDRSERERPHWHFVSANLTLRVPRLAEAPPAWPRQLLQDLEGQGTLYGHTALKKPLPEPGCVLDHAVFGQDPELGEAYLQIIGITRDEAEAIERWDARSVLELLRRRSQLWITDPYRKSILRDPSTARKVKERRL
jgi:hypothetical protein